MDGFIVLFAKLHSFVNFACDAPVIRKRDLNSIYVEIRLSDKILRQMINLSSVRASVYHCVPSYEIRIEQIEPLHIASVKIELDLA
jgi:hypothetical protein